jgi:hypothetical protein
VVAGTNLAVQNGQSGINDQISFINQAV